MREKTGGIFLVPGTRQDNATENVGGTPWSLSSAKFMRSQKTNRDTHNYKSGKANRNNDGVGKERERERDLETGGVEKRK